MDFKQNKTYILLGEMMKISELIDLLTAIKNDSGDLEVRSYDMYNKEEFDFEMGNVQVIVYQNEIPYVVLE